jgi:hypothetical protein
MHRPQLSIVFGSMFGAGVLHFILIACSASSGGSQTGVPDARAQGTSGCTTWTTAQFYIDNPSKTYQLPAGLSGDTALPAGWEPIGGAPYASYPDFFGRVVYLRKCMQ